MKTLIKNGIVLTMNQKKEMFPRGYVLIDGTKIIRTGSMEELSAHPPAAEARGGEKILEEDADGAVIMPGMVNTHCHMGMIPFRGLGDDCRDRLRVFLLPMELKAMDREMAVLSSRYAVCELLLSGVTTVMDMYYFAGEIAGVMDRMGIRGFAGETVMEKQSCDALSPEDSVSYGEACMRQYRTNSRVKVCLSPHGTTTCSGETLRRIHEIDREMGVPYTLHVAEMDYESDYFREKFSCTPVEFLDRIGVLDDHTIAAHSIRLTEEDIRRMAERKCHVAHCIGSNTKAAKGVAPVSALQKAGVSAGLGTDGPASGNTLDLFTQMRFCANFHKNEMRDRSVFPAEKIVEMATIEGARTLGISDVTGSIEPGKEADLVLVETDSVNMFPVYDPYSALVYSARPENVKDVYVAGECLVKDKRLVREDMENIRAALREKMIKTDFGTFGIFGKR